MNRRVLVARPWLGVDRDFEPNRLAKDRQARGYEEVLPVVRRLRAKAEARVVGADGDGAETEQVSAKGVAA